MNSMMDKMIVTNLRMEVNDYLQAKARAGELGMSVNEYFNWLAEIDAKPLEKPKKRRKRLVSVYEAFAGIGKNKIKVKPMGLSEEDEIIYGD